MIVLFMPVDNLVQCVLQQCVWRGSLKFFYAYSNEDAEPYGLSTAHIAKVLRKEPEQQDGLQFTQIKTEDETQPRLYQFWSKQS